MVDVVSKKQMNNFYLYVSYLVLGLFMCYLYVSEYGYVHVTAGTTQKPGESTKIHGTGVIGGCKLLRVYRGN